jgi:CheY-like chemotaxis protein
MALALTSAIEASRPHLEALGQTLELRMSGESVEVDGDLGRLAQVFSNLINNASKFSDRGSRISITVERERDTAIVRVTDTGVGIASDQLPKIFEMFAQVDQPQGKTAGGLGVGLWLAKTFIELHHGTIEARSNGSNRGSEFVVRLPVHEAGMADASVDESVIKDPGPQRRILVADDNTDAAVMLAETLGLTGHDVRIAHDGETALSVAADFRPDVVILDIGMPGLDGYEVARRLRQRFDGNVRLIALTGWGQPADRQRAAEAGFDQHLTKPVELADLYRAINR